MCGYQVKLSYDKLPSSNKSRALRAIADAPAAMIILVLAFLGFWFVFVLSVFHTYLICTNQTTYENFRDGYSVAENPWNKGALFFSFLGNVLRFTFAKEEHSPALARLFACTVVSRPTTTSTSNRGPTHTCTAY